MSAQTNNQRFTITPIEGNEIPIRIPEGFDTIAAVKVWCDHRSLPYYIFSITEWDVENLDGYGTPEIVASVNLSGPVEEEQTDLSFYSIF